MSQERIRLGVEWLLFPLPQVVTDAQSQSPSCPQGEQTASLSVQ